MLRAHVYEGALLYLDISVAVGGNQQAVPNAPHRLTPLPLLLHSPSLLWRDACALQHIFATALKLVDPAAGLEAYSTIFDPVVASEATVA